MSTVLDQVSHAPQAALAQVPHWSLTLSCWSGFLIWLWTYLTNTDLSGDPWTVIDLGYHHQTSSSQFSGVLWAVPHQWQGLFNPYLNHLPFGIIPRSFKYYYYLLFKLHHFSLEVITNTHFQPFSVLWGSFFVFVFGLFCFMTAFFYQADITKKHIFITIFFLKNPDRPR